MKSWFKNRTTKQPLHHSQFGGLWVDRLDALDELDRRVASQRWTKADADRIETFIRDGYVVLPSVVDYDCIDAFNAEVEEAISHGSETVKIDLNGNIFTLKPSHRTKRFKLLDLYVHSTAARNISCNSQITHFLNLIFDEAPLAFQSLTFEHGSQQRMHQDTAYVAVTEPMHLAASWVALENIKPGSGELEYFVGSHRLPDTIFSDRYKHWNRERDGQAAHDDFLDQLEASAQRAGLERKHFAANKGDALIWAADLAHGGSKIEKPATRKSHVTHYCPQSAKPAYWSPHHSITAVKESFYCSMYY